MLSSKDIVPPHLVHKPVCPSTMSEDPQPMTLQQRIASLNAAHIGRVPGEPSLPRPKPQVPQKRPIVIRQRTVNNPPEQLNGSVVQSEAGNEPAGVSLQNGLLPPPSITVPAPRAPSRPTPPPLPKRQSSQAPPPLPARKQSQDTSRRGSEASPTPGNGSGSGGSDSCGLTATRTTSNESSRVKAPAWGDVNLPTLPPRGPNPAPRKYSSEQPKYVNRAPSAASLESVASAHPKEETAPIPSLLPRLPSRGSSTTREVQERPQSTSSVPKIQPRFVAPIPTATTIQAAKRSALSFGLNKPPNSENPVINGHEQTANASPPRIPLSSRPDLSAIQATRLRCAAAASHSPSHSVSPSNICLVCRDFSGPDNHAARFPRQNVSSLRALAVALTSNFPSLTDKARAIFTWCHYNIRYDVDAFFSGNLQPSTPASTLSTGLAVCEGYAGLFANLAVHAGLEALVLSGHGKGFGYTPLGPNSPLPPYKCGHAWNAVRIDGGEWKLIDPCWGAGHVQGAGQPYVQKFAPEHFNMSNEEFGIKHFPGNKDHFFLPNSRRMTWEEYIVINPAAWPDNVSEPATVFTNAKGDYGIGEKTITPRNRKINVRSNEILRFSFGLLCPHWTLQNTRKGRSPVFMLSVGGVDGRQKDQIPLEYVKGQGPGGGGDVWYVDIAARELGAPGMSLTLLAITRFGDREDARGMTVREFREKKGKVGAAFMGVAAWDLV